MKIDFKNIVVTDIDGSQESVDISKELGKILYRSAISMNALDLAKSIYNDGEVEVDKTSAEAIKQIVSSGFLAMIQTAIIPKLEEIIDSEKQVENVEPSVEELNVNNELSE